MIRTNLKKDKLTHMAQESKVGARLKKRRELYGISLRKLAQKTGLSASFLSQVERNKTNLSLSSLQLLSEALEVPLLYFLADKPFHENGNQAKARDEEAESRSEGYDPVVTANARPMLILQKSGVIYELLVPSMGRKMVAISGRLSYGSDNVVRRLREPTEEFIYALSGKLLIELASGEYVLSPGDSIYFEGNELLRMACVSDGEEAMWISVISPAVF